MYIRRIAMMLTAAVLMALVANPAFAQQQYEGDPFAGMAWEAPTDIQFQGYAYFKALDGDFATELERVKAAIAEIKFGILWETDLQKIMKDKLDRDIPPYMILGACNPGYASNAYDSEMFIGALMPCNVMVMEDANGQVWVAVKNPQNIARATGNSDIQEIADILQPMVLGMLENL